MFLRFWELHGWTPLAESDRFLVVALIWDLLDLIVCCAVLGLAHINQKAGMVVRAPSAPQSFYLHEVSPHRRLPPSWEVMSGKVSAKTLLSATTLRPPNRTISWRPGSPWCAQAAGRAPAPRPKLPKDAGSKPKWSRSASLSRRRWAERGLSRLG